MDLDQEKEEYWEFIHSTVDGVEADIAGGHIRSKEVAITQLDECLDAEEYVQTNRIGITVLLASKHPFGSDSFARSHRLRSIEILAGFAMLEDAKEELKTRMVFQRLPDKEGERKSSRRPVESRMQKKLRLFKEREKLINISTGRIGCSLCGRLLEDGFCNACHLALEKMPVEAYFGKNRCPICGTTTDGDRIDANGYSDEEKQIKEYAICGDCAEYVDSIS